jgi:hypothetical protein
VASRILTKVVRAAAVAAIVELVDPVLDRVGISEGRSQLARALLKSSIAVVSSMLLGRVLKEPEEGGGVGSETPTAVLTLSPGTE